MQFSYSSFYQISFNYILILTSFFSLFRILTERLNSTSIQRHPSDRRTDSANLSIRSNGNTSAHLNASDLQSSFHGADTSMGAMGGGAQGGSAAATASCNDNLTIGALSAVAQQNVGAVSPGGTGALNDINAQDANEGNLRRERYVCFEIFIGKEILN